MTSHLSFQKGMTNTPSDLSSDEAMLEVELGMSIKDAEHHVIQHPHIITQDLGAKLVFIHDYASYTHLIAVKDATQSVNHKHLVFYGYDADDDSITSSSDIDTSFDADTIIDVKAVKNTLIVATEDGLRYYVYKGQTYAYLGDKLPDIDVKFQLSGIGNGSMLYSDKEHQMLPLETPGEPNEWDPILNAAGIWRSASGYRYPWDVREQTKFNQACVANASKMINAEKHYNHFAYPFWARAAYRLYDGRNIMISQPVLMLPSVVKNGLIVNRKMNDPLQTATDANLFHYYQFRHTWSSLLITITKPSGFNNWSDIIKGVDIYLSREVLNFEMDDNWHIVAGTPVTNQNDTPPVYSLYDRVGRVSGQPNTSSYYNRADTRYYGHIFEPTSISSNTLRERLIDAASVFYKALELNTADFLSGIEFAFDAKAKPHILETLENQTQLEHDDFFNHCKLIPNSIFAYNKRLQITDIKRDFYKLNGMQMMPLANLANTSINAYVEIETDSGTKTVKVNLPEGETIGYYFFYPDPRAKYLYVELNSNVYQYQLTQHPHLNGAYFLRGLPDNATYDSVNYPNETNTSAILDFDAPSEDPEPESLVGDIMVSEVDNPFLFVTDGVVSVGSAPVIAIVPNTDALSEGQYGQFPMFAFTKEGIWALTVNSEGQYAASQPMSRDVCNNASSITQTDNAVFFTTKKGLMVIQGRKVIPVSDNFFGSRKNHTGLSSVLPDLHDIIDGCRMAYDYINRRLLIFHPVYQAMIVYSIKYGTFSYYMPQGRIESSHILYPDTLLQGANGRLLSLMRTPLPENDPNLYSAVLVSRPLKLDSPDALKKIKQMEHYWLSENSKLVSQNNTSPYASLETSLYASDDLHNWVRLPSLRTRPYKYFIIKLEFVNLKATDVYAGTTLISEPMLTHRLRNESGITPQSFADNFPLE